MSMPSSGAPTSSSAPRTSLPPTSSSSSGTSSNQLYSLASRVPLIKSPSLSLPKPVKLPPDLHPLPADIAAYFVYPFSLESYVLDPNTPSSSTIDQLLVKHQQYLQGRQREKEEQQRELLRKVAPGWQGDVLMPTSSKSLANGTGTEEGVKAPPQEDESQERTPLDDLADHLAQLDALHAAGAPTASVSSRHVPS